MKLNWKVRVKNPYFWLGLIGVILSAMGVEANMLNSWEAVWQHILELISNPYLIGSVAAAVLGVLVDPTTAGIGDSRQALAYTSCKSSTRKLH